MNRTWEAVRTAKNYFKFVSEFKKPAITGGVISLFFLFLYPYHLTICKGLSELFSPNLMLITANLALTLHAAYITLPKETTKKFAASIYEVSNEIFTFLISGSIVSIAFLYFKDYGLNFDVLILKAIFEITKLVIMLQLLITIPFYLLDNIEVKNQNAKEKIKLKSSIYILSLLASTTLYYFIDAGPIETMNFCS